MAYLISDQEPTAEELDLEYATQYSNSEHKGQEMLYNVTQIYLDLGLKLIPKKERLFSAIIGYLVDFLN